MFTALINGEKVRATKNAHHSFNPVCQECSEPVIARCGNEKVWHWAHSAKSACPAGAGETDWHLHWKTLVNVHETEVRTDVWPNNRADICLDLNDTYCVIELQHSSIDSDTIEQREAAYGESMVWVVDVRGRDFTTSIKSANEGRMYWKYASSVWSNATRPVIFDTGTEWVLWLRTKWTRVGSQWFLLNEDHPKQSNCVIYDRPTKRQELSNLMMNAVKRFSSSQAEVGKRKRAAAYLNQQRWFSMFQPQADGVAL